MASDTSSDINTRLLDKETIGTGLKKETTETDLYLGLIANPSKTMDESAKSTSSLHYNNDSEDMSADNSTSEIKQSSRKDSRKDSRKVSKEASRKKSKEASRKASRKASKSYINSSEDSSKPKYEKVVISDSYETKKSEPDPPPMTNQQIRMKKIELLRKLSDIKTKGYKLSKEYDFNSSIEEMEYEYDLLKSFVERRNGIKLYKNTILNVSNIIEFFNGKYDPFGIKLDGWSEHMNVELDSYDEVMEELYEKYKSKGKSMPPELKLLMLIVASASAFHFSKSFLTKMPGMNGIMDAQPEIMSKIINGKKNNSQFMSEQELNINRQRTELQERDKQLKKTMRENQQQQQQQQFQQQQYQQQQYQQQQYQQQQQQYQQPHQPPQYQQPIQQKPVENFQTQHKSVNFTNPTTPIGTPSQLIQSNDPRNIPQSEKIIKSSESVKDILSRLHSRNVDTADTQDEQSSINDRLVSDTRSDSSTGRTKKTGKKNKNLMSVL